MKRVPLNLGRWPDGRKATQFAVVDDRDYPLVSKYRWHTATFHNVTYARTNLLVAGKRTPVTMHRLILGLRDSSVLIDHRDTNGLNNRRNNLRRASKSQNAANSGGHCDRKSRFKGVSFEKFTGRWLAQLFVNGKRVLKARFDEEEEAGRAYARAARVHTKQFAHRKPTRKET